MLTSSSDDLSFAIHKYYIKISALLIKWQAIKVHRPNSFTFS